MQALITDLSAIDTSASYNAFDAMLILLREGFEALLIVMALVTTLKAAKMRKGLKWVSWRSCCWCSCQRSNRCYLTSCLSSCDLRG